MPDPATSIPALFPGAVAVLGLPWDGGSTFLRGPAEAPERIREALRSPARNQVTESGLDLAESPRLVDLGNLELPAGEATLERVEETVGEILATGARCLALGGDHSLTLPLLRAYARRHQGLSLLQLDAHPDLYEDFEGRRYSHASPFARILEEGLVERLVQVGIRSSPPELRRQAERYGVEVLPARELEPLPDPRFQGPVYVSLDLDVLDPAFAPGVSHPEPGGLSTRQVITLLQRLEGDLVGADLVELNPRRDPAGLSALVAAKLVKELAGRMLEG